LQFGSVSKTLFPELLKVIINCLYYQMTQVSPSDCPPPQNWYIFAILIPPPLLICNPSLQALKFLWCSLQRMLFPVALLVPKSAVCLKLSKTAVNIFCDYCMKLHWMLTELGCNLQWREEKGVNFCLQWCTITVIYTEEWFLDIVIHFKTFLPVLYTLQFSLSMNLSIHCTCC
jgi:hypothetical protein